MVICQPPGPADPPFRSAARLLVTSLGGQPRTSLVLDVLRPPTFGQLTSVLLEAEALGEPYHVLHFDGHAILADIERDGIPPELPQGAGRLPLTRTLAGPHGYVVFDYPTREQTVQLVDGASMGELLAESRVSLLVLNACQPSRTKGSRRYRRRQCAPDHRAGVRLAGSRRCGARRQQRGAVPLSPWPGGLGALARADLSRSGAGFAGLRGRYTGAPAPAGRNPASDQLRPGAAGGLARRDCLRKPRVVSGTQAAGCAQPGRGRGDGPPPNPETNVSPGASRRKICSIPRCHLVPPWVSSAATKRFSRWNGRWPPSLLHCCTAKRERARPPVPPNSPAGTPPRQA